MCARWGGYAVCRLAATVVLAAACLGACGRNSPTESANDARRSPAPLAAKGLPAQSPRPRETASPGGDNPSDPPSGTSSGLGPAQAPQARRQGTLADLLAEVPTRPPEDPPRNDQLSEAEVDEDRILAHGIRKITGKHLTLFTDLPAHAELDELPRVFDLAVPQWCRYFHVDAAKVQTWHMTGCLMNETQRFEAAGLVPEDLPSFLNGYQRGRWLWFYEQPTAYYRRHLLLHEGTHGFMKRYLGGAGPPWYMEGTAELLGTHLWRNGQLQLGYFPQSKSETPHWGRIRIVREGFAGDKALNLTTIMNYPRDAHLKNEPYGWCWAAAAFLDKHPSYRVPFRQLRNEVADRSIEFSRRFYRQLDPQWPRIELEWQLFVANLDYGYDVAREAVQFRATQTLPPGGREVQVAADRGWQSSGIRLEAGRDYLLTARGRYQIADQPSVWWCEPGGVTIRYYQQRPLGILLGAVHDENVPPEGLTALARPAVIGLGGRLHCRKAGTLYLRVNDSPAELNDNAGTLTVQVQEAG